MSCGQEKLHAAQDKWSFDRAEQALHHANVLYHKYDFVYIRPDTSTTNHRVYILGQITNICLPHHSKDNPIVDVRVFQIQDLLMKAQHGQLFGPRQTDEVSMSPLLSSLFG